MTDSDDDQDEQEGVDLTGFLFGNVDESGRLESDVFDSETQRQLASLGRLGLGSLLQEMMGDVQADEKDEHSESDDELNENKPTTNGNDNEHTAEELKNDNFDQKSPSAVDYSDINELADDEVAVAVAENKVR